MCATDMVILKNVSSHNIFFAYFCKCFWSTKIETRTEHYCKVSHKITEYNKMNRIIFLIFFKYTKLLYAICFFENHVKIITSLVRATTTQLSLKWYIQLPRMVRRVHSPQMGPSHHVVLACPRVLYRHHVHLVPNKNEPI